MVRAPARCAARVAVARQSVIRDGPRTHHPAAAAADARPRLTGGTPIACAPELGRSIPRRQGRGARRLCHPCCEARNLQDQRVRGHCWRGLLRIPVRLGRKLQPCSLKPDAVTPGKRSDRGCAGSCAGVRAGASVGEAAAAAARRVPRAPGLPSPPSLCLQRRRLQFPLSKARSGRWHCHHVPTFPAAARPSRLLRR